MEFAKDWRRIFSCILAITFSANAWAFDPTLLTGGKDTFQLSYSGMLERRPPGSSDGIDQQTLRLAVPVYRGETDRVTIGTQGTALDPGSRDPDVTDLYDVSLTAAYAHQFSPGKRLSLRASYGSASNKPFHDRHVNTLGATAIYSFPDTLTSSWILLLNYSNNRPILNNIPLPGFAWLYYPSKDFRLALGLPFAHVYWRFAPKWSVTGFTVIPWVLRTTLTRELSSRTEAWWGFDFSQQTFFRAERINRKERIFFDEKKLLVGIRKKFTPTLNGEWEGGWAFNRRLFEAENYGKDRHRVTDLDSGWVAKASLSLVF